MAAIPKPASTVVLLDKNKRVYMTKRPETMKFLGGHYVFPGGSIDKNDKVIDNHFITNQNQNYSFHPSYYVAAARELYEEIGILLCSRIDEKKLKIEQEKNLRYRRQLIKGELSFNELLKKEKLYFDLSCLTYFGNFVTPEKSPIRFDTRFFLAYLPEGQEPNPDNYEIEEGLWITPEEALSANNDHRMPMVLPTLTTLKVIHNFLNGYPLKMPEKLIQ